MRVDVFSCGNGTVMAAFTSANDLGMVNVNDWYPRCSVMTGLAQLRRVDVCRSLARCIGTVMTAYAVVNNTRMIENNCCPVCCAMTGIAGRRGWNMVDSLTGCNHPVVTAFTGTQHFVMIHLERWRKGNSAVTGATIIRGIYMGDRLTCRDTAIVAADTRSEHFIMINS